MVKLLVVTAVRNVSLAVKTPKLMSVETRTWKLVGGVNGFPLGFQLTVIDELPTSAAVIALNAPGTVASVEVVATIVSLLAKLSKFKSSIPIWYVLFGCNPLTVNVIAAPWLENAMVLNPSVETFTSNIVPGAFPLGCRYTVALVV